MTLQEFTAMFPQLLLFFTLMMMLFLWGVWMIQSEICGLRRDVTVFRDAVLRELRRR